MSLFDSKEASISGLLQPTVAQSIVAQLIHGVAFLHSQNIVHGGNVLVQFAEAIDHSTTPELYERFGAPEPEAVVRLDGQPLTDGVPSHVFVPGWFGDLLGDFGESFNPQKTARFSSKTLPLLQPPEARFSDAPLSFASDIWTLACTVWEIFGQRPLFEAYFPTPDRVTAEQVEVLGLLPSEWWEKWSQRADWFNEEGELSKRPNSMRRAWEQRFSDSIQEPRAKTGLKTVTKDERNAFEAMMRSMLAFRPGERATAQQLMHSEWMKGWGQPAQERSWGLAKGQ
ncbi:uncharacterized protein N7459_006230 [Penicillium hispanicum]|uniref:uncharacterized protein n=1 Tax=Penicillium hispanicum TaxID=1080232 RepID=UPI002541CCB3|nr:uncharacterized protein N7459_006230 [Penicillium hispanicum]KAJ5580245.1 hypothetical protein N7459_006230 [Penicillium hispanicum]